MKGAIFFFHVFWTCTSFRLIKTEKCWPWTKWRRKAKAKILSGQKLICFVVARQEMKYYTWSQTALIFLKDRIIFLKMLYGSKKIRISISLLNLLQVQICPSFDCFHSIFMQNVSPRIIHRARPTMRVLIRHPIFLQPNFAGRIWNKAQLRIFPEMRLGF